MKEFILLSFMFSLFYHNSFSQTPDWEWAKGVSSDGDEIARNVATDPAGNAYVVGYFTGATLYIGGQTLNNANFGTYDAYWAKYDPSGNLLWVNQVGGSGNDYIFSVSVDNSGNICFGGTFRSPSLTFGNYTIYNDNTSTGDLFVVKCDANGEVLWVADATNNDSSEAVYAVTTDSDNNVYATGHFQSAIINFGSLQVNNAGAPNQDVFVVKYDANGNEVWAKSLGGSAHDVGNSIKCDNNGNVFVCGQMASPTFTGSGVLLQNASTSGTLDAFVVKFNSAGILDWALSGAGSSSDDVAQSVACDTQGNCYVGGFFKSNTIQVGTLSVENTSANGISNFLLFRVNADGSVQWLKTNVDGTGTETINAVTVRKNGEVIAVGSSSSAALNSDAVSLTNASGTHKQVVVLGFNASSGNTEWGLNDVNSADDEAWGVSINASGYAYVCGQFASVSPSFGTAELGNIASIDAFIARIGFPTALEESVNAFDVIFPNPAKYMITISSENEIGQVCLYDANGKLILSAKACQAHLYQLNVSSVSPGVYFLTYGSTIRCTKKMLID